MCKWDTFWKQKQNQPNIETYDRRDKPSVLVTSPSSPDRVACGGASSSSTSRYTNRLTPTGQIAGDPNVGGRIQIKLGFEPGSLELILTIICAAGLTYRANGAPRNPYVKVSFRTKSMDNGHCLFTEIHSYVYLFVDFFTSGSMW